MKLYQRYMMALCALVLAAGVALAQNSVKSGNLNAVKLEAKASAKMPKAPAKAPKFKPVGAVANIPSGFALPQKALKYKSPLCLPAQTVGDQPYAIGSVYSCDGWTEATRQFGPYTIGLGSYAVERMSASAYDGLAASFFYDGKFFMASPQYEWIFYSGMHVEEYDVTTWECLRSETVDVEEFALLDAAWNPADNRVYTCMINGESYSFGTFDPTDFSFTPIANLGTNGFVGFGIYDSTGYGLNQYGDLYRINLYTGELKLLGATDLVIDTKTSAAVDSESGKMYYLTNGGTSALYEINLTSAKATKLFNLTANERVVGLSIPTFTSDVAPAAVTNLSATAIGSQAQCKLSFTIPDKTYDGTDASGNVNYTISANGVSIATGTAAVGSTVEKTLDFENTAYYTISVVLDNEAGSSVAQSVSIFVGEDTPAPSASVTLERTAPDKLTLSWLTPEAEKGGYLDGSALTYDVADNVGNTVKTGVTGNSCEIDFSEPTVLTAFQYSVTAHYKGTDIAPVWSNILYFGNIVPPYSISFKEQSAMDGYTIINANNDEETWGFNGSYVYCPYNSKHRMDDWFITPGIYLEEGSTYTLSSTLSCMMASTPERIEIMLGTEPTAEAMTQTLMGRTLINDPDEKAYKSTVTVEADGVYYIGFHGISDADMFFLRIHALEIMEPVESLLPAVVTDLAVTTDPAGAKTATISFTAPSVTVSGKALTSLTSGVVKRNDVVIKTIENPTPGTKYTFEDSEGPGGNTTYSVVFENEKGASEVASVQLFVGINVPAAITDASATKGDAPGSVVISWSEVTTDIDGKTPPAGSITYNIVLLDGNEQISVVKGVSGTSYTIENAFEPDGTQKFCQWGVFPVNEAGAGGGYATNGLILGANYTVPFAESFANAKLSHLWFIETAESLMAANVSLLADDTFSDVSSQDADNGLLAITAEYSGSSAAIVSGIIDLDVEAPVLNFYSYGIRQDNTNEVDVYVNCGYGWEYVNGFVINGGMSWNRYRVDLADFAGQSVRIMLEGTLTGATVILLDNISITEAVDYDLAVSAITAPARISPDKSGSVKVKVENFGASPSGAYTLNLYEDGRLIDSAEGNALAVDANRTHEFTLAATAASADAMDVYAKLIYGADEVPENNESDHITILVPKPNFPAPDGLTASVEGNTAMLEWNRLSLPEFTTGNVVEDFEDAVSFSHEVFGWTMVDLDGSVVGGIDGTDIPGIDVKKTKCSFFVFDNNELGGSSRLNARSGDKCLAAIFNYDDSQVDDWAISPVLSGAAQTISFYAKSFHQTYLEKIEVYYAMTETTAPADFVKVEGAGGTVPADWTEYTAALPAGAKRFAIRSCAAGGFILLVDDVAYDGYRGSELKHIGYNVYDNGVKANDAVVTAENFRLNDIYGEHLFCVSALYEQGESRACEAVKADLGHVDGPDVGSVVIAAEGREIVVTGARGHKVAVASADGRIVAAAVASDSFRTTLPAGVYIVTAGDKVAKVLLK